jgi:hypothetical protein
MTAVHDEVLVKAAQSIISKLTRSPMSTRQLVGVMKGLNDLFSDDWYLADVAVMSRTQFHQRAVRQLVCNPDDEIVASRILNEARTNYLAAALKDAVFQRDSILDTVCFESFNIIFDRLSRIEKRNERLLKLAGEHRVISQNFSDISQRCEIWVAALQRHEVLLKWRSRSPDAKHLHRFNMAADAVIRTCNQKLRTAKDRLEAGKALIEAILQLIPNS